MNREFTNYIVDYKSLSQPIGPLMDVIYRITRRSSEGLSSMGSISTQSVAMCSTCTEYLANLFLVRSENRHLRGRLLNLLEVVYHDCT